MYSSNIKELDDVIILAREDYQTGNKHALDDLYERLMPFCLRVCSKTCGRYIYEYDEEASIARLAVIEAMEKYDAVKGSFTVFLGQVIHSRIIDHKRREKKHSLIPFTFLSQTGSSSAQAVDDSFFEEIIDDLARKDEITRLKKVLADFNISFEDLVNGSPRQLQTRRSAYGIAYLIAGEPELSTYLMEKKMLPIKQLESKWKIDRKLADRYRRFIIAAAIIQLNDFSYLRSYLLPTQGGDKNGR